MRFFGKIRGTKSDYYIAETVVEGGDDADEDGVGDIDEPKDADMEEKGTGVNKFTYYVTTNVFDSWKKLPSLSPANI